MIQRSCKYRFYPTQAQARQLAVEFGHARFVRNRALKIRSKAYRRRKEPLNKVSVSRVLTGLKSSSRYACLKAASATCHTRNPPGLNPGG